MNNIKFVIEKTIKTFEIEAHTHNVLKFNM